MNIVSIKRSISKGINCKKVYKLNFYYFVLDISEVRIIPSRSVRITAGTKWILVHCYVENANPETVEYQWFKGTSSNLSLKSFSQTLVFKTVDSKDGGQYTCRATNAAGTSNATVQVNVQCKSLVMFCNINIRIPIMTALTDF